MTGRRNAGLFCRAGAALLLSILLVPQGVVFAGGPMVVGGPAVGVSGTPIVWDNTKPIAYRVDGGPLSSLYSNAQGVTRVQGMFANWSAAPTANLTIQNGGGLLAVGSSFPANGDVKTVQDFLTVAGDVAGQAPDPNSCYGGGQSPIMFDADGSIFSGLGYSAAVIGFSFPCALNATTGKIISAGAVLNGQFQDGIDGGSNLELTAAEFDQVFTHEFGHFLGLDHSQINVDVLLNAIATGHLSCTTDDNAGMPLMFPVIGLCPARTTAGLPMLAMDDAAWISKLYPVQTPTAGKTLFASAYGTISGTVYFSDGVTPAQGVNVIARSTSSPRRNAVSVVSGYLFTGNPGQTVTCTDPANPTPATCSNLGSSFGSRDVSYAGRFDIPVPPGNYTLEVESIFYGFAGGSGVGPLDPPIPSPGTVAKSAAISVTAGGLVVHNITLQGTPPRFDAFESAWLQTPETPAACFRRQEFVLEKRRA